MHGHRGDGMPRAVVGRVGIALQHAPTTLLSRDHFFQYSWILPEIFATSTNKRRHLELTSKTWRTTCSRSGKRPGSVGRSVSRVISDDRRLRGHSTPGRLLRAQSSGSTLLSVDAARKLPVGLRCRTASAGIGRRCPVSRRSEVRCLSVSAGGRRGLRRILEAGIRIFEWNGTMLRAKSAVADTRWARMESTNLNLASFGGSYELDVAIDDVRVAREIEAIRFGGRKSAAGGRRRGFSVNFLPCNL